MANKEITDIVLQLRDYYLEECNLVTYKEINSGYCVNFAEDVTWEARKIGEVEQISNDTFILEREDEDAWCGDGLDIYNVKELSSYGSPPPLDFTGEQLGKKIMGYHAWSYYEGKHYDAECPEGVANFFDLPFFQRQFEEVEFDKLLASVDQA